MAQRPKVEPSPQVHSNQTLDQMKRGLGRLQKQIAELKAFDPQSVRVRGEPKVEALGVAIDEALTLAFGHNTVERLRYGGAEKLDWGDNWAKFGRDLSDRQSAQQDTIEARQFVADGKERSLILLLRAEATLKEDICDIERNTPSSASPNVSPTRDLSKVFVVHGHDEGAREAVSGFIRKLGFEPIILNQQANRGMTVIEKVEANAAVGFAVVLLTPDDEGSKKGGTPAPRARQNVLLELGYFIGLLGRKHVCALQRGTLEIPSDFAGVVTEPFDEAGAWQRKLATELEDAGFTIDWKKAMRP